jgi:hypothetical protein
MNDDDPYADLKQHALSPEMILERRIEPPKMRRRRQQFVKVPWTWVERLAKARHASTLQVAHCVLYLHWHGGSDQFPLANGMLPEHGIDRWRKWRGLRELEELGLIAVERRGRKSPLITIIV